MWWKTTGARSIPRPPDAYDSWGEEDPSTTRQIILDGSAQAKSVDQHPSLSEKHRRAALTGGADKSDSTATASPGWEPRKLNCMNTFRNLREMVRGITRRADQKESAAENEVGPDAPNQDRGGRSKLVRDQV